MITPTPWFQKKEVAEFVKAIRLWHKGGKLYVISPSSKQWTFLRHEGAVEYIRSLNPQGATMKHASAYYVAQPSVEIYVFVDEEASGLPEGAAEICKDVKSVDEFLDLVEPYFILAKDK